MERRVLMNGNSIYVALVDRDTSLLIQKNAGACISNPVLPAEG